MQKCSIGGDRRTRGARGSAGHSPQGFRRGRMSGGAPCVAMLTQDNVTGGSSLRISEVETAGTSIYRFLGWQGTALPSYLWCFQPRRGAQGYTSHLKMTSVAIIAPADTNRGIKPCSGQLLGCPPSSCPPTRLPLLSAIVPIPFGGSEEGPSLSQRRAEVGGTSLGQQMISFADSCLKWT